MIYMDRYIYKLIYKMRISKVKERDIKVNLKKIYKIECTMPEIKRIIDNIPITYEKYTEIEKRKILYLYSEFVNTEKLILYLNAKYDYGLTVNKLKDFAHRNNVKKKVQNMYKQSFVDRNTEYKMARMYKQGLTANEIAKRFGYKTRNSVLKKLDKLNIKRRDWNEVQKNNKTYINFSMERLDSEYKAYFLGLLLTDGYIDKKRGFIGLELTDKDAIIFLSKYLNAKFISIKSNHKTKYRIILYGNNLLSQVERLGVIENKTFDLRGPNLNEEEGKYLPYIIRGIIDGDGWIRKDGNEFFISSASREFINWCKNSLEELGFENIKIRFVENEYNGIYLIRSARRVNIELLKSKVYNKSFGMERKYKLLL